jgi:arsenite methyltransferase
VNEVREAVRTRYQGAARQLAMLPGGSTDAEPGCCGTDGSGCGCGGDYSADELREAGLNDEVSLGCGNPLMIAQLQPGEIVLDLGSGAGLDVLLSARRVAPEGHAYGVDMTGEMLELANLNKARAGIDNATFLEGAIEQIPLPENAVDVVISNCVINLAEDKGAVLREAFRVLRPGGRLAVFDMVQLKDLPEDVKAAADAWAGCISGTIPLAMYQELLVEAGFEDPAIEITEEREVQAVAGAVASATVRGRKSPARPSAG